jgi:hypothetical protein
MSEQLKFDREQTRTILEHCGVPLTRSCRFKKDDSFAITKSGYIKDYGATGFSGSVISYLCDYEGYEYKEALKTCCELANLPLPEYAPKTEVSYDILSPISQDQMDYYIQESMKHEKRFTTLLRALFPGMKIDEVVTYARNLPMGYSSKQDRLILANRNIEGEIVNLWQYHPYKLSFKSAPNKKQNHITYTHFERVFSRKVLYKKNRRRVPFFANNLISHDSDVLLHVVEGEKDALNCDIRGIPCVTMGGANMYFPAEYLEYFKGKRVRIVYDYDEPGYKGTLLMYEQLKPYCEVILVTQWETKAKEEHFVLKKGFDVTDYFVARNLY